MEAGASELRPSIMSTLRVFNWMFGFGQLENVQSTFNSRHCSWGLWALVSKTLLQRNRNISYLDSNVSFQTVKMARHAKRFRKTPCNIYCTFLFSNKANYRNTPKIRQNILFQMIVQLAILSFLKELYSSNPKPSGKLFYTGQFGLNYHQR